MANQLQRNLLLIANYYKFRNNPCAKKVSLGTGLRSLVYASSDRVLGSGLGKYDNMNLDQDQWPVDDDGNIPQNLLGSVLEEVQSNIV